MDKIGTGLQPVGLGRFDQRLEGRAGRGTAWIAGDEEDLARDDEEADRALGDVDVDRGVPVVDKGVQSVLNRSRIYKRSQSMMSMNQQHFRQLLISRRDSLIEDTDAAGGADDRVELDQTRQGRLSRMDAMQQQAMAAETKRRREQELRRIHTALARIDADDYGLCSDCGEDIAPARLEIDPAATRCIRCAEKLGG